MGTGVQLSVDGNILRSCRHDTKEKNLECVLEAYSLLTGMDTDTILDLQDAKLYLYTVHGSRDPAPID